VIKALRGLSGEISLYPSVDAGEVVRFYQKRFRLPEDSILPGNGAIELIYLAPRALGFSRSAVVSPCFHDYVRASRVAGASVSRVSLSMDDAFKPLSIKKWEDRIAGVDAVFIGSPNNPTGTIFPPADLLEISEKYPDKFFLVDQAFIQFADHFEKNTLMRRKYLRPGLVVFHSLTKFYSLAGLRIGAVISHPETIARLKAFKEPWTVNAVAEKAVSVLAFCRDFEEETRQFFSHERQRIYSVLKEMRGIKVFEPKVNFFLAQWTVTSDLDDLLRELLSMGFYVRDCRNFPGLEKNFFRFSIRSPIENDRLMDAICEAAGT
jgi:threonine-phosphate decarboxylase